LWALAAEGLCVVWHVARPGGGAEAGGAAEASQGGNRGGKRCQEKLPFSEEYEAQDAHPHKSEP
ncbi:unnamed protein product, partial [Closterium sp. Naga37s-1]